MQTILGAGGVIGRELASSLVNYTKDIRLVSRNPEKINETDRIFQANLLIPEQVDKAVEGSSVVYVTVGFPYKLETWKENWPVLIQNVIEACSRHSSKLVFFDNIYMYDPQYLDGMNEETPVNPCSKKGEIRADIVRKIMDAVDSGKITALIARSADFYGPGIKDVSMLNEIAFKPLSQGKKANWMGSTKYKHSFTFTPDAGKATALLGNTDRAYNQVWHLPTAENPFTGKEWIDQIAAAMGREPRIQVATRGMVKLMGMFNPVMKEIHEMMYQYDRDYVFDSSKFRNEFGEMATPYLSGIQEIILKDYKK